jgi:hypothetical protein
MKSKLILSVAAPAAALVFFTAAEPASAQWGYRGFGWGPAATAAGIVGGAVAAATSPLWAEGYYSYGYPTYGYGYGPGYYGYGSSYAYGYAPTYGYGPGYTYGYGYSPNGVWVGTYASANRSTIAVPHKRHVRAR